jgi:hypothetical protein
MNDQTIRFGGGAGTSLTPIAILIGGVAILALLLLPRKYIVVPLLLTSFFIPLSQQLVLGGLHFMTFRILLIFAWVRLLSSGPLGRSRFRLNSIDKAVILWALSSTFTFILLWGEWGAVVDRLGFLYNVFGLYFLFRLLCHDEDDVSRFIKVLAFVCGILAICMLNEQVTGRNLFSVFGGVPDITYVREGKLRSQGAFGHPILAGTFGATLLPLFVGLWWQGKSRPVAMLGMISSTVVTLTSASSTPLMAYVAGVGALCFWPFRRNMWLFRWGTVLLLVALHLVMKAPVWALIGRVDLVGGSSSSHRYELIDQSIRHFSEWWLVGTRNVSSWGFEMGDTSNQYVDIGVTGGIFTLILFISIIVHGFKTIGVTRRAVAGNRHAERRVWALGAALFSNVVAYIGIVYWDQTMIEWYALLAMIVAAAPVLNSSSSTQVQAPTALETEPSPVGAEPSWADFA